MQHASSEGADGRAGERVCLRMHGGCRAAEDVPPAPRAPLAFSAAACDIWPVRLSRPRVVLRAVLLVAASAFMLWKAWEAHLAAQEAPATPGALLLSRIALVEGLLGILGLAAAGMALMALRARKRTHTLRLSELDRSDQDEARRRG